MHKTIAVAPLSPVPGLLICFLDNFFRERTNIMNVKNRIGYIVGVITAIMILWFSVGSVASAKTVRSSSTMMEAQHTGFALPAINGPVTGCVFQTSNGHYMTAVSGGGRTTDVIHTDATRIGTWEKFTLIDSGDGSPNIHYGIQTYYGYYLTAVSGGGRITDVIRSNATHLLDWEKFSLVSLGYGVYAIQTINGNYLTAVGGGGHVTDAIHSDATGIGGWEEFVVSCGH
jgi:hypothetical protein